MSIHIFLFQIDFRLICLKRRTLRQMQLVKVLVGRHVQQLIVQFERSNRCDYFNCS